MPEQRHRGSIAVCPADHPSERVELYDRLWAVVVGIDDYPNLGESDQLERAARDAKGVAGAFPKCQLLMEAYFMRLWVAVEA